jgi:hypothetical protein
MSPRLLVLVLAVGFTLGCNGGARTAVAAAQEQPPAAPAAPAEMEAAEMVAEPAPAAEPAPVAEPARFAPATRQATTAPLAMTEQPVAKPFVIVPTTSEAAQAVPADAMPPTAAEHFDAQLAALSRNAMPADPPANIAEDDRRILGSVVDSLMSFRMTLRAANALRQTKVAPLLDLSEKVRAEIPLSLPTLTLCRSVERFGVYDPIEPARFTAGRATPVVVYCEVDHFRSNPAEHGGWETKLTYEAVLYSDAEAAVAVINKKPTQIVDRCRNRRRDFFLADRMTIPANLPVGRYVLKVTVIDQLANLVAEKTVPVFVAPN